MDNIFVDKFGNPDFKGIGPTLKSIFYLYALLIMVTKDINYAPVFIMFFSVGSLLTAVRNYYIDTSLKNSPEDFFAHMIILEYSLYSAVFFFAAVYLLTNRYVKNW